MLSFLKITWKVTKILIKISLILNNLLEIKGKFVKLGEIE